MRQFRTIYQLGREHAETKREYDCEDSGLTYAEFGRFHRFQCTRVPQFTVEGQPARFLKLVHRKRTHARDREARV